MVTILILNICELLHIYTNMYTVICIHTQAHNTHTNLHTPMHTIKYSFKIRSKKSDVAYLNNILTIGFYTLSSQTAGMVLNLTN